MGSTGCRCLRDEHSTLSHRIHIPKTDYETGLRHSAVRAATKPANRPRPWERTCAGPAFEWDAEADAALDADVIEAEPEAEVAELVGLEPAEDVAALTGATEVSTAAAVIKALLRAMGRRNGPWPASACEAAGESEPDMPVSLSCGS